MSDRFDSVPPTLRTPTADLMTIDLLLSCTRILRSRFVFRKVIPNPLETGTGSARAASEQPSLRPDKTNAIQTSLGRIFSSIPNVLGRTFNIPGAEFRQNPPRPSNPDSKNRRSKSPPLDRRLTGVTHVYSRILTLNNRSRPLRVLYSPQHVCTNNPVFTHRSLLKLVQVYESQP